MVAELFKWRRREPTQIEDSGSHSAFSFLIPLVEKGYSLEST